MATPWAVPPMWRGQTVAILASGASMSHAVADSVVGSMPTVVINNTVDLAPGADVIYGCDAKAWIEYPQMLTAKGIKVTLDASLPNRSVMLLRNDGQSGFSADAGALRTGHNSGFQALQLAVLAGAQRILLLGYDMRGKHWFGDHPQHLQDSDAHVFDRFIAEFERVAPIYARMGVDVVNCTPASALTCFRSSTVEIEMKKQPEEKTTADGDVIDDTAGKTPEELYQEAEEAKFARINLILAGGCADG